MIVAVEYSRSGNRSGAVSALLINAHFAFVAMYQDGMIPFV